MSSAPKSKPRWGPWRPRLFLYFNPVRTYLSGGPLVFRNSQGKKILDVDDTQALLLLGYAALLEIGRGQLPTRSSWEGVCEDAKNVIWARAQIFDDKKYWERSSRHLDILDWQSHNLGSLEIEFLHDALLLPSPESASRIPDTTLWCVLCLLWIDRTVASLELEGGPEALDAGLRASEALSRGRPRLTLDEARSILARQAAQKKLEKDPKQGRRRKAKEIWHRDRDKYPVKSDLARYIQDEIPDLENMNVIMGWFRRWEKGLE